MSGPFQLFPDLPPAVESALRSSIEKHGVLVPVFIDQNGRIIDGHHRARIAGEIGVEFETITVTVGSNGHARELAETLNMDRRHLDVETRRQVVADLRSEGHSTRAIAKAVGTSHETVRQDIRSSGGKDLTPETVVGTDGKRYPATRRPATDPVDVEALTLEPDTETVTAGEVGLGDTIIDEAGEAHPIVGVDDHGDEVALVDSDGDAVICAPDTELKRMPQRLGHPAPFTPALIPIFAELLRGHRIVLDPFAGTGRIHQIADLIDIETVGVELEPEWAEMHDRTVIGDATDLDFEDNSFDAICTSPSYGNRMADHHNAQDGSHRQTYAHMLGRALTANNSGAMAWGADYRDLHGKAWAEAFRVLEPAGRLIVNVSDHIRDGQRVAVAGWHAEILTAMGFRLVDVVPVATPRMRAGANASARVDAELILVFRSMKRAITNAKEAA